MNGYSKITAIRHYIDNDESGRFFPNAAGGRRRRGCGARVTGLRRGKKGMLSVEVPFGVCHNFPTINQRKDDSTWGRFLKKN